MRRHSCAYRTHDTVPATGFALDLGGGSSTANIVLNNLAVSEPQRFVLRGPDEFRQDWVGFSTTTGRLRSVVFW